jgi:hypothetical protein
MKLNALIKKLAFYILPFQKYLIFYILYSMGKLTHPFNIKYKISNIKYTGVNWSDVLYCMLLTFINHQVEMNSQDRTWFIFWQSVQRINFLPCVSWRVGRAGSERTHYHGHGCLVRGWEGWIGSRMEYSSRIRVGPVCQNLADGAAPAGLMFTKHWIPSTKHWTEPLRPQSFNQTLKRVGYVSKISAWAHFNRKPKTAPNRAEMSVFSVFGFGFQNIEVRVSVSASVF